MFIQVANCFSRLFFFSRLCDVVYVWTDAGGAGRCPLVSSSLMAVAVINS